MGVLTLVSAHMQRFAQPPIEEERNVSLNFCSHLKCIFCDLNPMENFKTLGQWNPFWKKSNWVEKKMKEEKTLHEQSQALG
jgi:hypothetical protein